MVSSIHIILFVNLLFYLCVVVVVTVFLSIFFLFCLSAHSSFASSFFFFKILFIFALVFLFDFFFFLLNFSLGLCCSCFYKYIQCLLVCVCTFHFFFSSLVLFALSMGFLQMNAPQALQLYESTQNRNTQSSESYFIYNLLYCICTSYQYHTLHVIRLVYRYIYVLYMYI